MIIMTHFPYTKIKGILLPRIRLLPIINLSSRIGIIEGMDHEELPIADLIWNMGFQDEGTAGWIGKMARLATISIWCFSMDSSSRFLSNWIDKERQKEW